MKVVNGFLEYIKLIEAFFSISIDVCVCMAHILQFMIWSRDEEKGEKANNLESVRTHNFLRI